MPYVKIKSKINFQRNSKIYKSQILFNIRMFPSDPTGSLDDLFSKILINYLKY